jgi:hypothetical protein
MKDGPQGCVMVVARVDQQPREDGNRSLVRMPNQQDDVAIASWKNAASLMGCGRLVITILC